MNLPKSIALLSLAAWLPCQAVEIDIPDYSLVPDGQNIGTTFQHTNVNALNGGAVLPTSSPNTVYVVSKFTFGSASDAHLQWQFSTSSTVANRIGIELNDDGLVQTLGTGDGILQAVSPTTPKRTTFNLAQDMAGQTITLLAKLHYNSTLSVTYDARTAFNGSQSTSDDTLMNVWINPDSMDLEGSGLTAGDLYALWNSAGFSYFRQTIQNQLTPGTSGNSSITDTVILTGADATFTNALAIATGATPGVVSATISTVSASPTSVPADGTTISTVSVTLRDAFGDPISGKDVTLANTAGPQAAVIAPLTAVTTDANGLASFTVKSSTPGVEVFTATDVTDSLVITQTASVAFVDAADPALSTVVATPTYVNADGTSTSTITVTLLATGNVPVPNKQVTLAGLPATATITPAGSQLTDINGQVTFNVSSSTPGQVVFTATDVSDSLVITQTATVNFAGPTAAGTSTVTASIDSLVANGTSQSIITVSLKDSAGIPVTGEEVTLAGLPAIANIVPAGSQPTNANGQCTFVVSAASAGTVEFTATAVGAGVVVADTASVEFIDSSVPLAFNVSFVQFTPGLGNFEDPATLEGPGGGSSETWNQIQAVSGSNLFDSNGAATGVSVTTNFTECRQRSTVGLALLFDGLTDFDKGLSRTVTLSGLPPGSFYNLYLASTAAYETASERSNGTFSTTNTTSTLGGQLIDQSVTANTMTWEQGNNYVLFENVVVNGSGQIILTAAATAGYRMPLSGFQLDPVGKALITSFGIAGNPGVINQTAKTIALEVPFGTNLATLAPEFTLSSGIANQTSGAPPSPTFAAQNPATYQVTDTATDPDTVNTYTVTVTVGPKPIPTTTLVINLGTGTVIEGSKFGTFGATNLPLPTLPTGSILRSIAVNTVLEATDNSNYASDLAILLDPTPATPGTDFSVGITNGVEKFGATVQLGWPASANQGVGTPLVDTKTGTDWASAGTIDLSTTGLFLGNGHGGPVVGGTWSGTITLTYDLVGGGDTYATWSGGAAANLDANGDGVENGVAWALGAADPNVNAISLLPTLDNTSDPNYVIFKFYRSDVANDAGTTIAVQYSNDLVNWTTAVDNADIDIIVTPGTPTDEVLVKLKRSTLAAGGRIFARLNVVVTP